MTDLDAKNQEMAMKGTIRRQPFAGATGDQPSESPLAERHDGPDKASLHMGWQRISHKLKGDLGEAKWKAWIKPLTCEAIDDSLLILRADTSFLRDRVLSNYAEKLRLLAKSEFDGVQAVDVVLHGAERASPLASQSAPAGDYPPRMTSAMGKTEATPHLAGPVEGLDSRLTFDNFIVGKPNQLAFAIAKRVAESAEATYNPLFLYGGVGLGKTHLMHAIAWEINHRQPHRKVMYLSAEKFMYRFIRALRYRDMMSFKEQFRSVDVLMIDDVQFISGKDSTQEEFFHTFNALVEDGRQVVLSADKSPTDLSGMEERLRSRLGWGMVADIHPADYELRLGILQARRDKSGVDVSDKVLDFLARKITSNIREIEGAFNRIVAHATLVGREITVETSRELLADLLRASSRRITVDDIQKQVASHFHIRVADMFSARRSRQIARPRQIAMYLAKNLTSLSYPEIGRRFGNRDHTTIMHAVRKVEELMVTDTELANDVNLLKSVLSDH
ncbi:chromosomal replication initiator protein DnaA [SAR116 cluster alpha proteobacterium HIMB100]|nr:chromosomal replication initiator protein DnaA [SAR116 cluster alpha proteobacterium HIMB100]